MKIKVVVIDVETPAWLRRTFSLAIPLIGVLVAGVVLAQPKQWATGDPLTAADLNHINVLEVNGVKYSVGATHYCGIGPVQTTGHIAYNSKNGFPAAKALCEASSGCNSSPTAHMCDAAEIARSLAVGDSIAAGWYSTETMAATTSGNNALIATLGR